MKFPTFVKTTLINSIDALFDVFSRRYVDIIIDPGVKFDENRAFNALEARYTSTHKTLFTADRGYIPYNNFAHVISEIISF